MAAIDQRSDSENVPRTSRTSSPLSDVGYDMEDEIPSPQERELIVAARFLATQGISAEEIARQAQFCDDEGAPCHSSTTIRR